MLVNSTLHRGLVELVPADPGVGRDVRLRRHRPIGATRGSRPLCRRVRHDPSVPRCGGATGSSTSGTSPTSTTRSSSRRQRRARRCPRGPSESQRSSAHAYEALGVADPDHEPKATEHIPEMLDLIDRLIDRGLAYPADNGDVYFAVRSLESYGKLSGRRPDELLSGARIEVSEEKNDPLDFALWKAAKPGEPAWDSPWGAGPARVAHRVLRDGPPLSRHRLRHSRGRQRSDLSASRERDRPVRRRHRRDLRPVLAAQRHAQPRWREDVEVDRSPGRPAGGGRAVWRDEPPALLSDGPLSIAPGLLRGTGHGRIDGLRPPQAIPDPGPAAARSRAGPRS